MRLVESFVTWFSPRPDDVPELLNSPFDVGPLHPLAQRAMEAVQALLRTGHLGDGLSTSVLHGVQGGKMFGVLLVRAPDGRVGFLRGFSGQLEQRWDVAGWVPPVFDRDARRAVEPPGEKAVKALTAKVEAARADPIHQELKEAHARLLRTHEEARRALRAEHEARRAVRHQLRATAADDPARLAALDRESQTDDMALRDLKREWAKERAAIEALLHGANRRLAAVERLRRIVSQEVSWQLYDTYLFENALGHRRSLRALFEPTIPSSGTGDCAAPKLLVFARRHGLTPLGLAEFWWGAPPPGGGRLEGQRYPACRDKCGPLLPFLLEGTRVAPSERYRPRDVAPDELEVLHEDERLAVVNKPEGLLSVPGTDASVTDSVLARVKARWPNATGPLLVHRLDVETSGLLLVALDHEAFVHLQAQFIERTIFKRYVAVLDGTLERDEGRIELPLRVDLEQRPRQVVDFELGKPAATSFRVLERSLGRTRVELIPHTGRTHQLRVHAAHRLGLGLPIVGDRLYGRPERRLLLHAEHLRFVHPGSGETLAQSSNAPF